MPVEKTIAPYGSWRSPITAEMAASAGAVPTRIQVDGEVVYYLERRPNERGRCVIVRCDPDGSHTDVTPPEFDVRTRVHEYGGGDFIVRDDVIYFVNGSDQRVYRQANRGAPEAVTQNGTRMRYADFCLDRQRRRLVCVREDHSGATEAANTLVAIDLVTGGAGQILASGYDFYSTPRLDPQAKRLAWLSWRHPNMPWDGTELWVADIGEDGDLRNLRQVAGGASESIYQPEWSPGGVLHFVSDRTGWWNLYRLTDDVAEALHPLDAEFGQPQWVFDRPLYGFLAENRVLCAYLEKRTARLGVVDTAAGALALVPAPLTDVTELRTADGFAVLIAGSPTQSWTVLRLDFGPGGEVTAESLTGPDRSAVDEGYLAIPEKLEFPTEHGMMAYAYLYRPRNPLYQAAAGERPPLLVVCHGGPTEATAAVLSLPRQYWTSRGLAVLDVDYGGSTGYGRAYRERLRGQWGVVDVEDCVNGAKCLVERGEVDPDRAGDPRRQRRRIHHLVCAHVHRRLQGGSQSLRHRRPRGAGKRHAQVRITLSGWAGGALSGRKGRCTTHARRSTSRTGCPAR